jgi:hypothetical protein
VLEPFPDALNRPGAALGRWLQIRGCDGLARRRQGEALSKTRIRPEFV